MEPSSVTTGTVYLAAGSVMTLWIVRMGVMKFYVMVSIMVHSHLSIPTLSIFV